MKLFCAYAFTGESLDLVTDRMKLVVETLTEGGHDAYCNRFDPVVDELQANDDIQAIFKEAFKNIEQSDALIAVVTSPSKSIGQIMEIGLALSQGKSVYLFEHVSAKGSSYLPRLVQHYASWSTNNDLADQLRTV